jgi:hypothetical protein
MKIAPISTIAITLLVVSPALSQAQNDHQIVPGQRVGPVTIGMSAADLYRAMGEPTKSRNYANGAGYSWGGLQANLGADGRVIEILVLDGSYLLVGGLAVGSSQLALSVKRPQPAWSKADLPPGASKYCYSDGLVVWTDPSGSIQTIDVVPPGCN